MISTAIMAHPARKDMVADLLTELPADTYISWDAHRVEMDTARRALSFHDESSDWHLVIQDDAVLCNNFMHHAEEALARVKPNNPVSFYLGRPMPHGNEMTRAVAVAQQEERSWIVTRGPMWGVCVAYPTKMLTEFLEAAPDEDLPYDEVASEFFWSKRIECWYTLPSLADHRDEPSLLPNRQLVERRARVFTESPDTINWDSGFLRITDPSEPWAMEGHDYKCMWCGDKYEMLHEILGHHAEEHEAINKIDFLASTPETAAFMARVYRQLSDEHRGTLYLMGLGLEPEMPGNGSVEYRVCSGTNVKRRMSRDPRKTFTVVDYHKNLRFLGLRSGWSLDGYGN